MQRIDQQLPHVSVGEDTNSQVKEILRGDRTGLFPVLHACDKSLCIY